MTNRQKIKLHRQTVKRNVPVVFCAACGSTTVDQNSVTELRCYSCGNSAPWDASRFGIRRGLDRLGEGDVTDHFESIPCVPFEHRPPMLSELYRDLSANP